MAWASACRPAGIGGSFADRAVHSALAGNAQPSFTGFGAPPEALSGPFLFSTVRRADGWAGLDLTATDLAPGTEFVLQIVAIPFVDPATFDPSALDFNSFATLAWSLETAPELRQLRWTRVACPRKRGPIGPVGCW